MDKDTALRVACGTLGIAFHSIGDYSEPNDGFCRMCPGGRDEWNYQNHGNVARFVLWATVKSLVDQGFTPNARELGHVLEAVQS